MKKILLTGILAIGISQAFAQLWTENFDLGFPTGWKLYNQDARTPNANVAYVNNAWVMRIKLDANGAAVQGDSVIVSTSYYTPAGQADDWVVTPSFMVNDPNTAVKWDEKAFLKDFADGYEVRISTTGDAVTDFTTVLYSTTGANAEAYTTRYASLASYNGQTVHIAFRNNTNGKYLLALDNIEVYIAPNNDISLTSVTPKATSPAHYEIGNTNMIVGGSVFNMGLNAITSFTVKYQFDNGSIVSDPFTGVNIPAFTAYTFNNPTTLAVPGITNDYPLKMWVELASDADATNDSGSTTITSVMFKPTKKILIEEGTGTWCGWCPRGAVYMDSLFNNYSSKVSLVAVHNNDPMKLAVYDNFMGPRIGGYPSVLVDRRGEFDPGDLIDVYNAQKDNFGFAEITLADQNAKEFGFSVKTTVKPALNLSGSYALALVITEDNVSGAAAGYAQANYYSNYAPLVGAGHDWMNEPEKVPSDKMEYDFVARHIFPNPNGETTALPQNLVANTSYDYTFSVNITPGLNRNNMNAAVLLINSSNGEVLNTAQIKVPLGIAEMSTAVEGLSVYPNPSSANATLAFNLNTNSTVNVIVTDAVGRNVFTLGDQILTTGNHKIKLNTANLPTGLYNVKIETENGSATQRISIVK